LEPAQWRCYSTVAMLFVLSAVFAGCKKSYEAPPETGAPNIVANTTIKDLKARYTAQGTTVAITDSVVISGIVNMDDKSGNYYQQISIQDETGGILLRLAGSNLNTNYPVGRRIFVKCKGLFLGDYGRMIQLGGGVDSIGGGVTLLAANLQDQHIIKGALNQSLVPKVVTVAQLGTTLQDPYVNTLIQLDNFEFASGDLSKNYADAAASGNRTIQGCTSPSSNKLTLRTSDFANFATLRVPQGNGTILGIYSLFNSTKQLTIRDTTDVMFYGPRCTGGGGTIGGTVITLGTTSPYTLNFDNIGTSLPNGVFVSSNATSSTVGTPGAYTSSKSAWNLTGAGFKNVASATGLTSAATVTEQDNSTNRALAVRQTSTVDIGGDPGASFIFLIDNTTGKSNLKMDFQLQSLDATSSRTTTWVVEYALGDNPASFTSLAATGTLTTGNSTFSNNAISVTLPSAVNNQSQKVWIRVFAKTATTGGGNRATTAIDDVKFTWN
jgi:hypothetical protein